MPAGQRIVVLRGGHRDGESTRVAAGTARIYTTSDAPGLVDIYEATDEFVELGGNDEEATIYRLVGRESAEGITPEMLHTPPS